MILSCDTEEGVPCSGLTNVRLSDASASLLSGGNGVDGSAYPPPLHL